MNRGRSSFGLNVSFYPIWDTGKLTNVHTGLLEGDEHVDIVSLGTDGSNDRGLAVSSVLGAKDSYELPF